MQTAVWVSIAVVVVLLVLLALYLWVARNSLVTLRVRVDEAWRDITVQLQRRADLIPGLVGAVRQYAAHETVVFEAVAGARAESLAAASPGDATVAENHLQQALRSVFSAAEAYPPLQASPEFLQLQGEIADTEERIRASRRFYNGGVREFNTKIQVFPNTLFARRLGFEQREFFETSDAASVAEPPRIQF
ncbi:LemA family protein [uncultured Amnibacterium sp.]|uniref:LemA family protein n=1 Tax=uncultured Amnibacterium sp. TaxID=1631851 RepID=UPI0035CB418C